jgi:hypothetical protein
VYSISSISPSRLSEFLFYERAVGIRDQVQHRIDLQHLVSRIAEQLGEPAVGVHESIVLNEVHADQRLLR